MTIPSADQRAAAVLAELGLVRHISAFGRALLERGVVTAVSPLKRHSAQGCALLAGKWLRRIERLGLAVETVDGWRAVTDALPRGQVNLSEGR